MIHSQCPFISRKQRATREGRRDSIGKCSMFQDEPIKMAPYHISIYIYIYIYIYIHTLGAPIN
jgi:hypothetical protein